MVFLIVTRVYLLNVNKIPDCMNKFADEINALHDTSVSMPERCKRIEALAL